MNMFGSVNLDRDFVLRAAQRAEYQESKDAVAAAAAAAAAARSDESDDSDDSPTPSELDAAEAAARRRRARRAAFARSRRTSEGRKTELLADVLADSKLSAAASGAEGGAPTLHARSPVVKQLAGSYRRAARNVRPDQMRQIRSSINDTIASRMSARDRRRMYADLAAAKKKYHQKPKVELKMTYAERQAWLAAKTNWKQVDARRCQVCGVGEDDVGQDGHFEPTVPCGHRCVCKSCYVVTPKCPSCQCTIDHALSSFLRPQEDQATEFIKIMSKMRRGRSSDLSKLRRATLARIRDAREPPQIIQMSADNTGRASADDGNADPIHADPINADATGAPTPASAPPLSSAPSPPPSCPKVPVHGVARAGDRTSQILHDLGAGALSSGAITSERAAGLEDELEETIRVASSADTAAEGQVRVLALFSKLSPRQASLAELAATRAAATGTATTTAAAAAVTTPRSADVFTLHCPDNSAWASPTKHSNATWLYDATTPPDGWPADHLPYANTSAQAEMARFRGRLRPRVAAAETAHRAAEARFRQAEEVTLREEVDRKRELEEMLEEDYFAAKDAFWRQSLAAREEGFDGHGQEDVIDDNFARLRRALGKIFVDGWQAQRRAQVRRARRKRSRMFALLQVEAERLSELLVLYRTACQARSEAPLRHLERTMSHAPTLQRLHVRQLSDAHVLCVADLLSACGEMALMGLTDVEVTLSKLTDAGARRLAGTLAALPSLSRLAIVHCQVAPAFCNSTARMLAVVGGCRNLMELTLTHGGMKDSAEAARGLETAMAGGVLRRVDLSHNALGAVTAQAIGNGASHPGCRVETVDVAWNQIGAKGVAVMLKALKARAKTLGGGEERVRLSLLDVSFNGVRLEEVSLKLPAPLDASLRVVCAGGTSALAFATPVGGHVYETPFPCALVVPKLKKRRAGAAGKKKKKGGGKQKGRGKRRR